MFHEHCLNYCEQTKLPIQVFPVESSTYPAGQSQRNDPSVFIQSPPSHAFGMN